MIFFTDGVPNRNRTTNRSDAAPTVEPAAYPSATLATHRTVRPAVVRPGREDRRNVRRTDQVHRRGGRRRRRQQLPVGPGRRPLHPTTGAGGLDGPAIDRRRAPVRRGRRRPDRAGGATERALHQRHRRQHVRGHQLHGLRRRTPLGSAQRLRRHAHRADPRRRQSRHRGVRVREPRVPGSGERHGRQHRGANGHDLATVPYRHVRFRHPRRSHLPRRPRATEPRPHSTTTCPTLRPVPAAGPAGREPPPRHPS